MRLKRWGEAATRQADDRGLRQLLAFVALCYNA